MKPLNSISEVIRHLRQNFSNPTALNIQEKRKMGLTLTEDFLKEVKYLALGLKALGLQKGDRVGILTSSFPLLGIADLPSCSQVEFPCRSSPIFQENFLSRSDKH